MVFFERYLAGVSKKQRGTYLEIRMCFPVSTVGHVDALPHPRKLWLEMVSPAFLDEEPFEPLSKPPLWHFFFNHRISVRWDLFLIALHGSSLVKSTFPCPLWLPDLLRGLEMSFPLNGTPRLLLLLGCRRCCRSCDSWDDPHSRYPVVIHHSYVEWINMTHWVFDDLPVWTKQVMLNGPMLNYQSVNRSWPTGHDRCWLWTCS